MINGGGASQANPRAAGSANLMSPQEITQGTLGANKRIGADMISKWLTTVVRL